MRESNYWIRLVIALHKDDDWKIFEVESLELMKILGTIFSKTSKRF